ncbi:hypothetical protein D3C77_408570 [compost metagenome]
MHSACGFLQRKCLQGCLPDRWQRSRHHQGTCLVGRCGQAAGEKHSLPPSLQGRWAEIQLKPPRLSESRVVLPVQTLQGQRVRPGLIAPTGQSRVHRVRLPVQAAWPHSLLAWSLHPDAATLRPLLREFENQLQLREWKACHAPRTVAVPGPGHDR